MDQINVLKKIKINKLSLFALILGLFTFSAGCVNVEKHKTYQSLEDAANDRIGVLKWSTQDSLISKKYPKAQMIRMDMNDLISALRTGNCDVVVLGSTEVHKILPMHPELKILQNISYSPPLGVGFNKKNVILLEKFNTFLSQIQIDNTYDQIIERWIYGSNPRMPKINLPIQGKPLKIGTTAVYMPFSYEEDGKICGLDIEIATRFAASIDRPIRFIKMNFDELIPALVNNNVDMIINGIMITTGRKEEIAFSNIYFQNKSTAIVMGKNMANTKDSSKGL
ncbi:MAG: transporter substrate-binding domain-containing protein [Bacteroidales bacterium]